MKSDNSENLNTGEITSLTLEALVGSLPYVGPFLQTAYFGAKNEKRFKRIETFYTGLSQDMQRLESSMATAAEIAAVSDELAEFMEATNNIIESQSSLAKRSMLHNAFLTILTSPTKIEWSETRFFMFTVPQIDMTDLRIMVNIRNLPADHWATVETVEQYLQLDHFFTVGLLERLVNFGYLYKRLGNISMKASGTEIDTAFRITGLGSRFLDFTMEPPVAKDTTNSDK